MCSSEAKRLRSRVRGTLLGAAIADALAFPHQRYSRSFLQSIARPLTETFEKHGHGHHPGGQPTDDTQAMFAVVDAFLERADTPPARNPLLDEVQALDLQGRDRDPETEPPATAGVPTQPSCASPRRSSSRSPSPRPGEDLVNDEIRELVFDFLVPLWRDLTVVDGDPETSESVQKVVRGIVPWHRAALPVGRASCGPLTRAIPIGLLLQDSPERIASEVRRVVSLTHEDPRVIASASGIAAAVAFLAAHDEIILGHLLDQVSSACAADCPEIAAAVEDLPRILSQTEPRALRLMLDVLRDPKYPPLEDGLGEYCVPVLLVSLHAALKSPADWSRGVERVLRLGGNIATTAAVTAALIGAHLGCDALSPTLLDALVEGWELERKTDEFAAFVARRSRAPANRRPDPDPEASDDGSDFDAEVPPTASPPDALSSSSPSPSSSPSSSSPARASSSSARSSSSPTRTASDG